MADTAPTIPSLKISFITAQNKHPLPTPRTITDLAPQQRVEQPHSGAYSRRRPLQPQPNDATTLPTCTPSTSDL
ncbi:hypothetical protein MAA_11684 [Metarhizium robertsii ARSEF 23]|uniref:Uncharacterized protein n=1 Tax=Metarhizium robertsii (strain ARSEF 23 / ATCC MYA-3075) TaxID=655844 RepID=A0A0B2XFM5_METRA|nr:uncharacterized protein MAA_11684 [Metarhizium robertsii ARSEF 23]KHO10726.1 hypothetical protein MAA_11684 [Metarhizium robertsii ARSEF 23]